MEKPFKAFFLKSHQFWFVLLVSFILLKVYSHNSKSWIIQSSTVVEVVLCKENVCIKEQEYDFSSLFYSFLLMDEQRNEGPDAIPPLLPTIHVILGICNILGFKKGPKLIVQSLKKTKKNQ